MLRQPSLGSRFLGKVVAGIGISTGYLRPDHAPPTIEEEAAMLGDAFRRGVEEVLIVGQPPPRANGYLS